MWDGEGTSDSPLVQGREGRNPIPLIPVWASVESSINWSNAGTDEVCDISISGCSGPNLRFGYISTADPRLWMAGIRSGPQLEHTTKISGPSTPQQEAPFLVVDMDTALEPVQGIFGTRPFLGIGTIDAADAFMAVVTTLNVKAFRCSGTTFCTGTDPACGTNILSTSGSDYIWNADSNLVLGHRGVRSSAGPI